MTRRVRKKRLLAAILLLVLAAALGVLLFIHADNQRYELNYPDEIKKYAGEYKLDAWLVAATIHVESGNRAAVISNVGAVGLMQLMPDTGAWIAEKLSLDPEEIDLTDPDTNIRFGCWYLHFLEERFTSRQTVMAAYNAGQGVVSSWLGDTQYSEDGETLSDIPYKETKDYVVKIDKAYEKYKKLYPDAF